MNYTVCNRYSPGSPALVDRSTAMRVKDDEIDVCNRSLAGLYGPKAQKRAERLGLRGVVYSTQERGGKIIVTDAITNEVLELTSGERLLIGAMRYADFAYLSGPLVLLMKANRTSEKFTGAKNLRSLHAKRVVEEKDNRFTLTEWIASTRI